MKKSGKASGWSKRWFVLNEKTGKVDVIYHLLLISEVKSRYAFGSLADHV